MTSREFSSFCKHAQLKSGPYSNFASTLALKNAGSTQNVSDKFGISPRQQSFGPGTLPAGIMSFGGADYNRYKNAIKQQESDGRVNIVNKTSKAMGLYQIMPKTLRGLKYQGSFEDFLKNPDLQDKYMHKLTKQNAKQLGINIDSMTLQQAKILAGAHYGGVGGAKKLRAGDNGYGNTDFGGKSPYGYINDIYNRMVNPTYGRKKI